MIKHLALIMDGNRRWAKAQGKFPWIGHQEGAKVVEIVIKYCIDQNIPNLSLYTFSLENFKRSEQEISYLFSIIEKASDRVDEFVKSGVRVRFVGNLMQVPEKIKNTCKMIEEKTLNGEKLLCNFLFCYGGQQEIIAAAQKLAQVPEVQISSELFRQHLWLGNIPDPEIIIRTGGVRRLSNFLLFQAAYAEIRFLECLWPDLNEKTLHEVVLDCVDAHKNYGK